MCHQNCSDGFRKAQESLLERCVELVRFRCDPGRSDFIDARKVRECELFKNRSHLETVEVYELDQKHAQLVVDLLCIFASHFQCMSVYDIHLHDFCHSRRQSLCRQIVSILQNSRRTVSRLDMAYRSGCKLAMQLRLYVLRKPQLSRLRQCC